MDSKPILTPLIMTYFNFGVISSLLIQLVFPFSLQAGQPCAVPDSGAHKLRIIHKRTPEKVFWYDQGEVVQFSTGSDVVYSGPITAVSEDSISVYDTKFAISSITRISQPASRKRVQTEQFLKAGVIGGAGLLVIFLVLMAALLLVFLAVILYWMLLYVFTFGQVDRFNSSQGGNENSPIIPGIALLLLLGGGAGLLFKFITGSRVRPGKTWDLEAAIPGPE